jgi:hypothetical protein
MALAFRDCCNQYSYFLLDNTPSFVSEFETYYIQTLQGLNFCAIYTNLPTLNYSPPVYTLSEMTQQTSCGACIISFPCPSSEVILVNQFSSGSVAQGTDCQIVTIPPIFVECVSTNPTTFNGEDGRVQLVVSGGVAPYRFLIAGTESFLQGTPAGDNLYTLYNGVSAGTYSITVQDSNLDFSITANCVLENPSQALVIEPIATPASRFGASDGAVEFVLTDGVPPFLISLNGEEVGLLSENLPSGIYYFEVSDQLSSQIIVVEVTQPNPITYPPGLCMTFELCGTLFNLNFIRLPVYENLKPRYKCTNPTKIGLKELYIRWGLGGGFVPDAWTTTVEVAQPDDIQFEEFPGNCNFSDPRFAVIGPFFNNEQPTGPWFGGLGFMQGKLPTVTPGGCPPTANVIEPIQTYCPGPPVSLAEVFIEGLGGSGGPYRFFYSTNGVNYIESPTNILYLTNGTYSLKVMDSDGIESLPTNFTVLSEVNIFRGNQIGFCGIVDPTSPGVTGILDRPINDGEYRDVDFTVTHFFDFNTIPEGTVFSGQFTVTIQNVVTSGNFGYGPVDKTEFLFDILEAYYVNDGVRSDFKNQMILTTNPFLNVSPEDVAGSSDLYTTNYGVYNKINYTDNCTASTVNPTRTSPNYWFSCDNLYNNASLIEGDTRGASYSNFYQLRAANSTFNTETKMALKMRIRMRSEMTPYIPEFFNQTDVTTLSPVYYTALGQTLINLPNEFNYTLGSETSFFISYSFASISLLQSPPSIRCFRLEQNLSSFGKEGPLSRLNFAINTSYGVNQPFSVEEDERYVDRILARNNTCAEIPSWAQ